jgi:hypothetical protein
MSEPFPNAEDYLATGLCRIANIGKEHSINGEKRISVTVECSYPKKGGNLVIIDAYFFPNGNRVYIPKINVSGNLGLLYKKAARLLISRQLIKTT